jgi:hypothetical protein
VIDEFRVFDDGRKSLLIEIFCENMRSANFVTAGLSLPELSDGCFEN